MGRLIVVSALISTVVVVVVRGGGGTHTHGAGSVSDRLDEQSEKPFTE